MYLLFLYSILREVTPKGNVETNDYSSKEVLPRLNRNCTKRNGLWKVVLGQRKVQPEVTTPFSFESSGRNDEYGDVSVILLARFNDESIERHPVS